MTIRYRSLWFSTVLIAFMAVTGCSKSNLNTNPPKAVAVLHPTAGHQVSGTVLFTEKATGTGIQINIKGLTPGKHGFHIHECGDCRASDASSAGGHYNPGKSPHGGPDNDKRHAGDLGNITAKADGTATYEWVDERIALNGTNSIIGHSVIIHSGEDDFTSQPSGNAGRRVACGVIGIGGKLVHP